jgi:hypothetical protein
MAVKIINVFMKVKGLLCLIVREPPARIFFLSFWKNKQEYLINKNMFLYFVSF